MESAIEKHNKDLITSLKLQDSIRRKWNKNPLQSGTMRKQKLNGMKTKKTRFYFSGRKVQAMDLQRLQSDDDVVLKKRVSVLRLDAALLTHKTPSSGDKLKLLHERGTHQSKLKSGFLERLRVEAPDIVIDAKTDIDPGFFTTIEGRPIKIPFIRMEYLRKEKEILLKRAFIMENNKIAKFLKKKIKEKENTLDNAIKTFPFHDIHSRNYIYMDFDITAEVYFRKKEAQKSKIKTLQKKQILENKVHSVLCNLYRLEEHWKLLKIFQMFLYQISPLQWRKEHDRIHHSEGKLLLSPTSGSCLDSESQEPSLEELLKLFYEVNIEEDEPKLYFTHPKQLKDYYNFVLELNANTYYHSMMIEEDCKTLNRFLKEIKNSIQKELEKIQNEHNNFKEKVEWFESKRKELNYTLRKEKENVEKKVLCDSHIEVRATVEGGYNSLLNPENLKVGLLVILKQLSEDVSRVLLEVKNLPPALFKRLIMKQEEALLKATEADRDDKRISRIEKKIKESTQKIHIPKHCKSLCLRTHPPYEKDKEEKKAEQKEREDLYTEDIFRAELTLEKRHAAKHREIHPDILASKVFQIVDEISEEAEEEFSLSRETRVLKSFDSGTSSIGLEAQTVGTKPTSISLLPNTTIELAPIDTKPHATKKTSQPLKKQSLIITDLTRRKISLLTNYEKSYSVGETEGESKEISFIDVVKTTRIKDHLLRWKNIFPSEKERISKSSLFQKDVPSPDPYLDLIQLKLKQTSTKWFPLKSDVTKPSPFLHSSYFPSLPIISETESITEANFDSNFLKLEDKLRECKIKYYQNKKFVRAERNTEPAP